MGYIATVFVADSSEDFCASLTAELQRIGGFDVVGSAGDGEQTIRMVEQRKPDMLVLDLMLPKKDGLTVLKAVSGMKHKPVVLATSVFISRYVSASVADLGVRYIMPKPCDMAALAERLTEIRGREILRIPTQRYLCREDVALIVTGTLHESGIPAHIKGYQYLREAIMMAVNNMNVVGAMTKVLYPQVAKTFGTTPSRVERAIRHAIQQAWDRGSLQCFFGHPMSGNQGKPTNGMFIAYVADRIRLQLKNDEAAQF